MNQIYPQCNCYKKNDSIKEVTSDCIGYGRKPQWELDELIWLQFISFANVLQP